MSLACAAAPPRAMLVSVAPAAADEVLMSVVCTATRDHVEVCGTG